MRNPQFSLGPMVVNLGIAGLASVRPPMLSMAEIVVQWIRAQSEFKVEKDISSIPRMQPRN